MKKTIEQLENDRMQWSKKVFRNATDISSLIKAEGELQEVTVELEEYKNGVKTPYCKAKLAEEYVDVIMCVFDSAGRAGISISELRDAFELKLEKNKERVWKMNADNTYSHVKN